MSENNFLNCKINIWAQWHNSSVLVNRLLPDRIVASALDFILGNLQSWQVCKKSYHKSTLLPTDSLPTVTLTYITVCMTKLRAFKTLAYKSRFKIIEISQKWQWCRYVVLCVIWPMNYPFWLFFLWYFRIIFISVARVDINDED